MTKTYTMYNKSDKYTINNGTEEIFEISKNTLSVDGKKLYDALFLNFEKGENPSISNSGGIILFTIFKSICFGTGSCKIVGFFICLICS